MNVFMAANDQYILPAEVMLNSFLINNKKEFHYIYFIHSGVKKRNIKKLRKIVEKYQAQLIVKQVNVEDFKHFHRAGRFSVETYYRFLITKYLPVTEKRAIWLDVDLIVDDEIDAFYYQDLNQCYLAGCIDIGNHKEKMVNLDRSENEPYINAGVLLLNAEKMRQYHLEDYYEYYSKYQECITWFDQDVINGMFSGKIKAWDSNMYNLQALSGRIKSQSDLDKAAIIHYIGPNKPWFSRNNDLAVRKWDEYYAKLHGYGKCYVCLKGKRRKIESWIWKNIHEITRKIYAVNPMLLRIRRHMD